MDTFQYKSKHEEHNCSSALTKPTRLTDFCLKIKESHPQIGIKRNTETWQDQEGTVDSSSTTKQNKNRSLFPSQGTTEQQIPRTVCQPTLRALERLACYMNECGNTEHGIFILERRSPDLEVTRVVIIEPTRTAPRSWVRQIFENGWFQNT